MDDINTICYNNFGIAFQWKRSVAKDFNKIQLVFKNTGLFLKPKELIQFSKNIEYALEKTNSDMNNEKNNTSRLFLLEAPNPQTSFSMTYKELNDVKDLVKGTLFQLELYDFLEHKNIY
ncbi:MAG: hypothetical protein ABJL44_07630 [Algibacter sp.]